MEQADVMEAGALVVVSAEAYILDEAESDNGLGELVAAAALEVVVDTEVSSMAQHMGHGPVETRLERLYGADVMEVRISQDLSLGQLL